MILNIFLLSFMIGIVGLTTCVYIPIGQSRSESSVLNTCGSPGCQVKVLAHQRTFQRSNSGLPYCPRPSLYHSNHSLWHWGNCTDPLLSKKKFSPKFGVADDLTVFWTRSRLEDYSTVSFSRVLGFFFSPSCLIIFLLIRVTPSPQRRLMQHLERVSCHFIILLRKVQSISKARYCGNPYNNLNKSILIPIMQMRGWERGVWVKPPYLVQSQSKIWAKVILVCSSIL